MIHCYSVLWPLGGCQFPWGTCSVGFLAKESVVSVLEVLFGAQGGVNAAISGLGAACILVFSLLYTPCVAAIAAIRRELGSRWALFVVVWQCVIAWAAALLVRFALILMGFH